MTIGALTVFLSYLNKFFKPVQDLAKMTNSIAQAAVGVDRVQMILDADDMIPEKPDAKEIPPVKGEITFDQVAFAYKPDAPVLKEVTFTIKPGQLVGFVGADGGRQVHRRRASSRASTTRPQGRILVDGQDVRDYKISSLRDQIGIVLQDTVLFRGTIADNIAYGRPDASRDEMVGRREARQRGRVHREDAEGLRQRGRRARDDACRAASGSASASRARSSATPRF